MGLLPAHLPGPPPPTSGCICLRQAGGCPPVPAAGADAAGDSSGVVPGESPTPQAASAGTSRVSAEVGRGEDPAPDPWEWQGAGCWGQGSPGTEAPGRGPVGEHCGGSCAGGGPGLAGSQAERPGEPGAHTGAARKSTEADSVQMPSPHPRDANPASLKVRAGVGGCASPGWRRIQLSLISSSWADVAGGSSSGGTTARHT